MNDGDLSRMAVNRMVSLINGFPGRHVRVGMTNTHAKLLRPGTVEITVNLTRRAYRGKVSFTLEVRQENAREQIDKWLPMFFAHALSVERQRSKAW